MKMLQNNFTTPESSKRLLELGVPEDSADCYYHHYFTNDPTPLLRVLQLQWDETIGAIRGKSGQEIYPCWSVGRLMEIFDICYQEEPEERVVTERWLLSQEAIGNFGSYIEYLVRIFEVQHDFLDFSKLEE